LTNKNSQTKQKKNYKILIDLNSKFSMNKLIYPKKSKLVYLAQYGHSFFSLWCFTQSSQVLRREQSFFGHGQLGADITILNQDILGNSFFGKTIEIGCKLRL
jgi:hypothetical protein